MKKTFIGHLALAALACSLFIQCQPSGNQASSAAAADSASVATTIAYINADTLLMTYDYAKKLNEAIISKSESSRADFNQKYRVFQQDAVEFQRKVQNNGFLSMERAQKEQQRLQEAEAKLQELNETLTNELLREQDRINRELRDTLTTFLNQYAKGRYSLILSNTSGDNVFYSAPGVDITADVVEQLNARYKASQNK